MLNIRKTQLSFPGHIMRKGGLEYLIFTGQIKDKSAERKAAYAYVNRWLNKVQEI